MTKSEAKIVSDALSVIKKVTEKQHQDPAFWRAIEQIQIEVDKRLYPDFKSRKAAGRCTKCGRITQPTYAICFDCRMRISRRR